jgi:dCTP deaminase
MPRQSNFSISSVALLAHEVGHVYFSCQGNIQKEITAEIIKRLKADGRITDLFNDDQQKLSRTKITSHIEEFFCDNIGHYLVGPVYNFAAIKMLGIADEEDLTYSQGKHPPVFKRLYNERERFDTFFNSLTIGTVIYDAAKKIKERYFDNAHLIPPLIDPYESEDDAYFTTLSSEVAKDLLLKYLKKESLYSPQQYEEALHKSIENLNRLIPPVETLTVTGPQSVNPSEMLIATTLYFSGNLFETRNEFYKEAGGDNDEKRQRLKQILINFIKYAINVYAFYVKVKTPFPANPLEASTVWNLRDRGKEGNPFVVVPTIDFERQYATNAVDLRLGNSFITSKLTEFTHIPTRPSSNPLSDKNIEYFFEKHFIPFNKNFTLHPHSFVLAVTLEYICIPADHYALVLGRSTWGRLGLNIATATAVGPGFKGCITLELRNLSEVPITLNVGTRICQICLIKNPEERGKLAYYLHSNKYICPTEAEYPKIDKDPDWEVLQRFSND